MTGEIAAIRPRIVTTGGRVLAITGMGENLAEALRKAYDNVSQISWDGMQYRKDIGQDLIKLGK